MIGRFVPNDVAKDGVANDDAISEIWRFQSQAIPDASWLAQPELAAVKSTSVIGIDIGGANLKYARTDGLTRSRSFPMWKQWQQVRLAMVGDLRQFFDAKADTALAITITGELADCFVDRVEGVHFLVAEAMAAADTLGITDVRFYGVDGKLHIAESAVQNPDLVAAANWHALASYVGREIQPTALLIDIGSTTTDIIPIKDQKIACLAKTDHERLKEGSLVYVGCRRTPVCALVERLSFRGQVVPVMNEFFATIDDAQLMLRLVDEDPTDLETADGKPRVLSAAANRLARMIGLDQRSVSEQDAEELSRQVIDAARRCISEGVAKLDRGHPIVLSGHGPGLVDFDGRQIIRLAGHLSEEIARCAPSFAVARLFNSELVACDSELRLDRS